MWGIIFVVALAPGFLIGWLVSLLSKHLIGLAACVFVAAAASLVLSKLVHRSPDLSTKYHIENLVTFFPPIALAMLGGWWVGRRGTFRSHG